MHCHRFCTSVLLSALLLGLSLSTVATADDRAIGQNAFEASCAICHGENPAPRALTREQLKKLPPEKIFTAQVSGLMALQASALNEIEKRAVAIYLSEIPWGTVQAEKAAEQLAMCDGGSPLSAADFAAPSWVGWGLDFEQTHAQSAAAGGLEAPDLTNLELKWSFSIRLDDHHNAACRGGRQHFHRLAERRDLRARQDDRVRALEVRNRG